MSVLAMAGLLAAFFVLTFGSLLAVAWLSARLGWD